MARIAGERIGFLVANEGVDESELTEPWEAVVRAGAFPTLIAPRNGLVQTVRHLDRAARWKVGRAVGETDPSDFEAVVLPGGVSNADALRLDPVVLQFLRSAFACGRPCGVLGHSVWVLVEANLVRQRKLTSWPSAKTDVRNAGGEWVDAESVVCRNGPNVLLSSRAPCDLPAFCSALLGIMEEHSDTEQPELELSGVWDRSGLPANA